MSPTGVTKCSNTTAISAERLSNYCYFCSNCSQPFTPNSLYVTQVSSNTGWCAMMSRTNSPDGVYTRGAALPDLCSSNGCSWKTVSGVTTWVCCCNYDLCNAYVPTTTTRPPALRICYYCSTCPEPFTPNSPYVTQVSSNTGCCARMSRTNSPDEVYTRGAASPGLCSSNGCSLRLVNDVAIWICCCNYDLCNTYIPTTTTQPPALRICYYCSTCPEPFTPNSSYVTQVSSNNGWCVVSLLIY
ncbi:unnamed protein product [Rotaria sp. Silwood2]|nr:unnamed protein product [Rotaria sp. Silwood2]